MYNILKNTLQKATKDNGVLSSNGYAKELLYLLEFQSEEPTKIQLATIDPSASHSILNNQSILGQSGAMAYDMRLRELSVKGLRKFPSSNWYHISFTLNNSPISSIFLGSNGVGKSSLYSALEYCCLGYSFLADERGYRTVDEQRYYLCHNNLSSREVKIKVASIKETREVTAADEKIKPLVTPAFFCSEYDIQEISREGLSSKYICQQLGLKIFHNIIIIMRELKEESEKFIDSIADATFDIKWLKRRLNIMRFLFSLEDTQIERVCKSFIDSTKDSISSIDNIEIFLAQLIEFAKKIQSEIILLDSSIINDIYSDIKYIGTKFIEEDNDTLEQQEGDNEYNDDINQCFKMIQMTHHIWEEEIETLLLAKEESRQRRYNYLNKICENVSFLRILEDKISEKKSNSVVINEDNLVLFKETLNYLEKAYMTLLHNYSEVINTILPTIFRSFFDKDIKGIEIKQDGLSLKAVIYAISPLDTQNIVSNNDPRGFLNTFRFKMFCFVFKFALACCIKKYHSVNFPFIVDDVFDSSDFANRTGISRLILSIIEKHNEIEGSISSPLQLLFFTQDNIIANSICSNTFYKGEVKFSRIYDYYHAENEDKFQRDSDYYINIEDVL